MVVKKTKKTKSVIKDNEKGPRLAGVVREIQSKYGEGSIMKLGEAPRVDVDAIPTGSISLDIALGVGGVPKGRVVEIFGPESSGKTTLALHIAAESQNSGGTAAFIDAEHALDPEYARRTGLNVDDLLVSQPDTGEQALDIVETLVHSRAVGLIVVDSVAALTPRAEIEGRMDEQQIGLQARLMSHALRKLAGISSKAGTTIVFLNQIRMKIGVMFGNPETTPGGKALKFYSSVRIEVRRIAQIKRGEEVVGSRIRAKIVKNKVAPPFRTAEFDIIYNEGISRLNDLIATGVKYDIVSRDGSWYGFGGKKIGQGLEMARNFLKENPETANEIEDKIKKAAFPERV